MTDRPGPDRAVDEPARIPVSRAMTLSRIVLGAAGLAAIGYGTAGLLDEPSYVDKWGVGRWLLGGLLAHDIAFAALVFGTGWLVMHVGRGRGPEPWVRRTLLGGLAAGVAATLVVLPVFVRPWPPPNPSALPLAYGRNLAVVWGVVAAGTGIVIVIRTWAMRRRQRADRR